MFFWVKTTEQTWLVKLGKCFCIIPYSCKKRWLDSVLWRLTAQNIYSLILFGSLLRSFSFRVLASPWFWQSNAQISLMGSLQDLEISQRKISSMMGSHISLTIYQIDIDYQDLVRLWHCMKTHKILVHGPAEQWYQVHSGLAEYSSEYTCSLSKQGARQTTAQLIRACQ